MHQLKKMHTEYEKEMFVEQHAVYLPYNKWYFYHWERYFYHMIEIPTCDIKNQIRQT